MCKNCTCKAKNEDKVIVVLDGGLVTEILSTNKNLKVLVKDMDIEGVDDDEIMSQEEIDAFEGDSEFVSLDYKSGVCE